MTDILNIPFRQTDGTETTLAAYRGNVILVVNVASKCGLTPQYEGLEKLYEDKRAEGLMIAAFPANNFMGQEPGTDAEILEFCHLTYEVKFPIFSKISVKGEDKHPLYGALTATDLETTGDGPMKENLRGYGIEVPDDDEITWNFEKFLIGRDGKVIERFAPDVAADDPRLLGSIEKALAASV